MDIRMCEDAALWDAYVERSRDATGCHLWAWKRIIEETYCHPIHCMAATVDGAIQGVLPLGEIKSRLFGHFLVSVPFVTYGGISATSAEARDGLATKAIDLASRLGARHVELRQGGEWDGGWNSVSAKVAMLVDLPATPEGLWDRLHSRLRNKIRRAQRCGLRSQWGREDQLSSFYEVFSTNMRNLGTPVYPLPWFKNILRFLPGRSLVLTLWDGVKPVAATLLIWFRETVELPWIASLPDSRRKYSTVLLYWTALDWAIKHGYNWVDLGRCTPGSGVHQFKKHWGCVEKPLHWYYWLAPGVNIPNLRASNPKFRLAIRLWKRLPLRLANWLGPRVVRSIP
jgi:FemAB-related protein (PEP-CTERM system-associated)